MFYMKKKPPIFFIAIGIRKNFSEVRSKYEVNYRKKVFLTLKLKRMILVANKALSSFNML